MTSSFVLRPVRVQDLDELYTMERAEFSSGSYPRFFFRQALDALGDHFLVATVDGALAGYILGSMQTPSSDAWILSLLIAPSFRRKGLATRLIQELLQQFVVQGASCARIHVSPANQSAMTLYDRLGFREQTYEEHYFGRGKGRWVLELSL
jgi:ribosomal protein S18 acetylase RimI-like enzyme